MNYGKMFTKLQANQTAPYSKIVFNNRNSPMNTYGSYPYNNNSKWHDIAAATRQQKVSPLYQGMSQHAMKEVHAAQQQDSAFNKLFDQHQLIPQYQQKNIIQFKVKPSLEIEPGPAIDPPRPF